MLKNIWGENPQECYFRRKIHLDSRPQEAFARIFADTGYELYINGRFVAGVDEWCNTRDYAVKIFLYEGENVISIHGINHGGHRAMAFELVADGESVLVSDEEWRIAPKAKWGWILPDYDDSGWENAKVLDTSAAGGIQWETKPGTERERIFYPLDCSQFFTGAVPKGCDSPFYTAKNPKFTPDKNVVELLGREYADYANTPDLPEIVKYTDILENSAKLTADGILIEKTERRTGPSFIVDMGCEAMGFFRMKIESKDSVSFRLYYGETIDSTIFEVSRDIAVHSMMEEEFRIFGGTQEFESHMKVAFRYVKVEFFDCDSEVKASDFGVRSTLYPVAKRGWFSCCDERLNKLWKMSEQTMHLCMQEYYLDAPRRDRFLWTGDARLEGLFNYYLFADTALFEYSMECLESVQRRNGAVPSSYGEGCSTLWDYIAWYVIAYYDYYMYTGRLEFVMKHLKSLEAAADYLVSLTDETGLINVPKNPMGKLWMVELNEYVGYDPYLNGLYYNSLEVAKFFADLAGQRDKSAEYGALMDKIAPKIEEWDKDRTVEKIFNETHHIQLQYEIAERYAKAHDAENMMKRLNEQWTIMVDSHSDCVHECGYSGITVPKIDEREKDEYCSLSYCHGWAAAAVSLLPMGIAGISLIEPGFELIEIEPDTEQLESFRCAVPTPFGEMALKLEKGEFFYYLPEGVEAVLIWKGEEMLITGKGSVK
ncbi:MAG: family 78 glycoside hydrolase catalytic domain [Clostridiales bacterium]|nr:family 78 glycoside hydrolase catalytic domain [Clostridiales bacterium]